MPQKQVEKFLKNIMDELYNVLCLVDNQYQ